MTHNALTREQVYNRCKELALELTPDLPKENTLEAWEDFQSILEDSSDNLEESVGDIDWIIYNHYGWKIIHAVSQDVINQAESDYLECNSGVSIEDTCGGTFDIWSMQSNISYFVLLNLTREALEEVKGDFEDMAEQAIWNLDNGVSK